MLPKIAYVTTYDATNINSWSGLGYNIAKALKNQGVQIDYIGELESSSSLYSKLKQIFYKKVLGKNFDPSRDPAISKYYAQQIQSQLTADADIIFCPSSVPVAFLKTKQPKIFYTDATFAGMLNFYDSFTNLCNETIKNGNAVEQKALSSCQLAIYSSEWAAQTAIDNYNVDPNKVKVVPFGANINCNRTTKDIKSIVNNRSTDQLNLLFIGVDWKRKGGDKAVEIAKKLNDNGISTQLHIVGVKKLPLQVIPKFVVNHGFINKNTPEGLKKIDQLFMGSHFLLSPTIADCTPVVYSEANSFGTPCISTKIGGISTIIKDDINGISFTHETDIEEWCEFIATSFMDNEKYKALCLSSFDEYQNRLNWNVAGKKIMNLIKEL